jgi:hypothetical protein
MVQLFGKERRCGRRSRRLDLRRRPTVVVHADRGMALADGRRPYPFYKTGDGHSSQEGYGRWARSEPGERFAPRHKAAVQRRRKDQRSCQFTCRRVPRSITKLLICISSHSKIITEGEPNAATSGDQLACIRPSRRCPPLEQACFRPRR